MLCMLPMATNSLPFFVGFFLFGSRKYIFIYLYFWRLSDMNLLALVVRRMWSVDGKFLGKSKNCRVSVVVMGRLGDRHWQHDIFVVIGCKYAYYY